MMAANQPTDKFIQDVLELHNKYRSIHSSSNLEINDNLNKLAQDWAEDLAKRDVIEHRPNNEYGENIYLGSNNDPEWQIKPENIVDAWYREIEKYKFGEDSPENLSDVGHFTQLIWYSTKTMGFGMATSETGKVIVVCNYEPAGNILLNFTNNVYPVKKLNNTKDDIENLVDEDDVGVKSDDATVDEILEISIGIPNMEKLESIARLYEIPSEKLRVLTSWLIKVTEEANAWQSWLQSHIDLILRMSKYLVQAQQKQRPSSSNHLIENSSLIRNSMDISRMKKVKDENVSAGDQKEKPQNGQKSFVEFNRTHEKEETSFLSVSDGEKIGDNQSEEKSEHPVMNSPMVGRMSFTHIPLPKNEEEMLNLIKQVKYHVKIYRLRYKNWKEIADRAYREIVDQNVMTIDEALNEDGVPYSYYVYTKSDMGISMDTKELITHNHQNLFFNLSDNQDI